jgi:hypothetical protein
MKLARERNRGKAGEERKQSAPKNLERSRLLCCQREKRRNSEKKVNNFLLWD